MEPTRLPKNFIQIQDEWAAWNANAGQAAPKFATVAEYGKFMDQREGTDVRKAAYDADTAQQLSQAVRSFVNRPLAPITMLGNAMRAGQPLTMGVTPSDPFKGPGVEEMSGETFAQGGSWLDKLVANTGMAPIDPLITDTPISTPQQPVDNKFETSLRAVGETLPRSLAGVGLAATGNPVGWAAMLGDQALMGYEQDRSLVSAAVGPVTTALTVGTMPAVGRAAGQAAAKAFMPGVDDLVQGSSATYGKQAVGMLTPDPVVANAVAGARIGAEAGVSTGYEMAGMAAEQFLKTGDVNLGIPEMAAAAVGNLAFVPVDVAARTDPSKVQQQVALETIKKADVARQQIARLNDSRGTRIADTHKRIIDAAKNGQDTSALIEELKSHFIEAEAARQPDVENVNRVLMSMSDDANSGRMSETALAQILRAVQGRFDELAKTDPESKDPGTVSGFAIKDLIDKNFLPKISEKWLQDNFKEAYEQALGDSPGTSANLVNRIVSHYQNQLPEVLEVYKSMPREEGLSRSKLDMQVEADKDVKYMESLLALMPHVKDKKAPDNTDLDAALLGRDTEMSSATQGNQLAASEAAWGTYDAWKDAIIMLAETYDPVTRTGAFRARKRMADGEVIEGSEQRVSIEDLVAREGDKGKYTIGFMSNRKIGQSVDAKTSLDAMLAHVSDKFGTGDEQGDIQSLADPEKADEFARIRRGSTRERGPDLVAEERLDKIDATREAEAEGLTGADKEGYVQRTLRELSEANAPAFGFDLPATNKEEFYDVALWLTRKVETADNAELWAKYGGPNVFGKGHLTPGKAQLFRDAILAKLESEMGTNEITVAQKRFYENWRKFADEKEGKLTELAKDWETQRAQFRHALRLYWRSVSTNAQLADFFIGLLDDRPDYQNLLRLGKMQPPPSGSVSDSDNIDRHAPGGRMFTQTVGQSDPVTDVIRSMRGFAKKVGLDDHAADVYGTLAGTFQQAFNENQKFGILTTPEAFTGVNIGGGDLKRPYVALNLGVIEARNQQPVTATVRALQVLAHELAHNYSNKPSLSEYPSMWRQQRADAYGKLHALFNEIGPEATHDLLNRIVPQVMIPEQFMPQETSSLRYPGADFGNEAVSRLMEFSMLGAFTKNVPTGPSVRKGADTFKEAFLWLPDEVQAFTRFAFRDLANFVGGLEDYYKEQSAQAKRWGTDYKDVENKMNQTRALLRPMMQFANEFLAGSVEQAQRYETVGKAIIAKLNASGAVEWDDPLIVRTTRMLDRRELQRLAQEGKMSFNVPEEGDPFGFDEQQMNMFGKTAARDPNKFQLAHEKRRGAQVPPWSRWLGQLYQEMRRFERVGVVLAEPATRILNELEPAYWRLTQDLHRSFTMVDKDGNIKYDPNHPVQLILRNKHPEAKRALQTMKNLALWSQDKQQPIVIKDEAGKTVIAPESATQVSKELAGLDPVMQQGVLEGIASLVDSYRRAAELRYSSELETVASQIAKQFMVRDRGMFYDGAFAHAQRATDAGVMLRSAQIQVEAAQAAVANAQGTAAAGLPGVLSPEVVAAQNNLAWAQRNLAQQQAAYTQSLDGLNVDQVASLEHYLLGPTGVANGLLDMANMFKARESWFISEARPGRYLVFGKTPDGKSYANGKRTKKEAEDLVKQLSTEKYQDLDIVDRQHQDATRLFDSPDAIVNSFIKLERAAWDRYLQAVKSKMSEADYATLAEVEYTPGQSSQSLLQNRSIDRYLAHREAIAGREDLNPFEVFTDYTRRMVGSVARRSVRQQIDRLLLDPRALKQGDFQQTVREAVNVLMQPVNDQFSTARAAITAMFLGMPNVVSPIVESTQMLTTVFPELVRESGSWTGSVKRFSEAFSNVWKYKDSASTFAGKQLLSKAARKEAEDPRSMTKEESMAYYYRRSKDEGRFQHGVAQQELIDREIGIMQQFSFGQGMGQVAPKSKKELASDALYWMSRMSMRPYSWMSGNNNRVAFMAGLDMFYDKGFRGRELYEKAHVFKDRATFGGGKPNEVGFVGKLSNQRTRSWFALVMTLQRYSFGSVTQIKDYLADAMGRTGLSGQERLAAAKAATQAIGAQVAFAGAMGIPGASIIAAILREWLGWDVKQQARETWTELAEALGADKPLAVGLANIAQNGVGGQFLGVDLSSRFTINSFLGFDAFEGWDAMNLGGPVGGVAERVIKAGNYVAKGDAVKATKYALPPSLTPIIDIFDQQEKYGQVGIRAENGRMISPLSTGETAAYAVGLRPYRYRLFRDQQEAMRTSDEAFKQVKDQKVDQVAAELRKGNSAPAFEWVREYLRQTPTANPQDAMRSVVDRALVQTNAQDLLVQTMIGNDARVTEIAQSFGTAVPRQSEVKLLQQREQLNAQTGFAAGQPADSKAIDRALLVDALIEQKGLSRSEALRIVTLMGY